MTEFESGSAPDAVGAPTMTYGLNDMGLAPYEPGLVPAAPRRATPVPIPQDVEALFINPSLADRFDRQWGDGAAKKLLDKYRILQSTGSGERPAIDAPPVTGEAAQVDEASEAAAYRVRRSMHRGTRTGGAAAEQPLPDMLPSERDPGLLQQQEVGLFERHRLNRRDSFYRGTLAGAGYLAAMKQAADSADEPGLAPGVRSARESVRRQYLAIVADLSRYDAMDPFGTELEAIAALTGQLTGGIPTPESLGGVATKGASALVRFAKAAAQQGLIALGTDPIIQAGSIHSGVQEDYDGWRTLVRTGLAGMIGPLGHTAGAGARHLPGATAAARKGASGEAPTIPSQGLNELPMDEASRMARARELGFNVDEPVYHGAAHEFSAFDPAFRGKSTRAPTARTGFWAAEDPDLAHGFARQAADGSSDGAQQIYPLFARYENHGVLKMTGRETEFDVAPVLLKAFDEGLDAVWLRYPPSAAGPKRDSLVVKNENQYRSWFARFDPAKKDSSELLASLIAGGALVVISADDAKQNPSSSELSLPQSPHAP